MGMLELASVDGRISPTSEASISVADDGLLRGDGVFEVIRLYEGRPFALDEHLDRLERSAAALDLDAQRESLATEIDALLEEFDEADAQLRLVVTRGGRRIAVTEPLPGLPSTVSLATVEHVPSPILIDVKAVSYAANMQATRIAQERDAEEALLVRPDGIVLEAPTSSIFWSTDGNNLRTPALEAGILQSITRKRILSGVDVEEGLFELSELEGAGEAFLASTVREVQPVTSIDGKKLADPPGPLTRAAREAFDAIVERELALART
jgi:branched-chain amino acid aminotransferase